MHRAPTKALPYEEQKERLKAYRAEMAEGNFHPRSVMKIEYDKEVEEGINLDLDEKGKVIGLEIIGATERYSLEDISNFSTENLILETPGRAAVKK